MARPGSPTFFPNADLNGPFEVNEGSSITLSGTGQQPANKAFIAAVRAVKRFAGKQYRDDHRKWYLGDSISAGIGQGYTAFTPVQLAHAMASIGDGYIWPHTHLEQWLRHLKWWAYRLVD